MFGESHVEGGNGHLGYGNGDEETDLGDGREPVRDVEFVLSSGFHRERSVEEHQDVQHVTEYVCLPPPPKLTTVI